MISVVVPVYNVEKYLKQCVDSLISQTHKDIEIILVDDGSTDNSGKLCDELKKKDERIIVVHKENQGLGMARNSGIEIAKGEYITFIDSDDYADKNLIKEMYDTIQNTNADTCIGGFIRVQDDGKIIKEVKYEKEEYEKEQILKEFLPRMIGSAPNKKDAIRMSVWNAIYSMSIIRENKLRFPSEREYISEDIIFDLQYYPYCNKVAIMTNSSYYYRVNMKSLTRSYKKDRFYQTKKLYNKELEMIKALNIKEEAHYRLMRQFFIYTLACIKQENTRISNKTLKQAIDEIKNICRDSLLVQILQEYPIKKLGIEQKIFLKLMQSQKTVLLYFAIKMRGR